MAYPSGWDADESEDEFFDSEVRVQVLEPSGKTSDDVGVN
jgi:hypothetical protein